MQRGRTAAVLGSAVAGCVADGIALLARAKSAASSPSSREARQAQSIFKRGVSMRGRRSAALFGFSLCDGTHDIAP